MRKIKKQINKSYHKRNLRNIKKDLPLKQVDNHTRPTRSIFFRTPSIIAYALSIVILVVLFVSVSKNDNTPTPHYDIAINHLEEHTVSYLKKPINTLIVDGVTVNVYYGISLNNEDYNHHLFIQHEKEEGKGYYVDINPQTGDIEYPSFSGDSNANSGSIGVEEETDIELTESYHIVTIDLSTNDDIVEVVIDLTEYYDELLK